MPENTEPQGPSLEEMLQSLAGQVGQLTQTVQQQQQTLAQVYGATAHVAQKAGQPSGPPDPDAYTRANEEYLKTLATDALGLRRAENQSLANEILGVVRKEMHATVGDAERQRRAEEMERSIFEHNPDIASEGPFIEYYLKYLNGHPSSAQWAVQQKIAQAVTWARENKAQKEQEVLERAERAKKDLARASMPGSSGFRDPGGADVETAKSSAEAHKERFQVLQGKRQAAMAGGGYRK